jgi:chemotaxis protein MotB
MSDDNSPIIIKKGKKGHEGHHGGAWKVAYADFVTAMMALFIVLWILGQSEEVKQAVSGYFKDPAGFDGKTINTPGGKSKDLLNLNNEEIKQIEQQREVAKQIEAEKEVLKKMGEEIVKELSADPDFKGLVDQVKIEIIDEGLRIELMEGADDLFFQVGTSVLNSKAKLLIRKIGASLAKLPNKVVIEGHTDSRPYQGDGLGYTNFELSADRANAARKELTQTALKAGQLVEVRGYADSRLRDKTDPYSLVNRRISIIVKFLTKK